MAAIAHTPSSGKALPVTRSNTSTEGRTRQKARKTARFWNRLAQRYSRQPIGDEAAYEKKLEVTRGYLTPEMEVLEIGCGTGGTALKHAPYVKHIRAVDISSEMLSIARSQAEAANIRNVTFEEASIDELSVDPGSVDAVLALSLLHLLDNREDVIARIHGMLKPGGVFVSSTACLGEKMGFFRLIAPIGRFFGLLPILRVFTQKELRAELINAGFEIDYEWRPHKAIAAFMVAKRPD